MTTPNAVCSKCKKLLPDDELCHTCGGCDAHCHCPVMDDTEPVQASWDVPFAVWGDEEIYLAYEGECVMCGRERNVNDEGYCSQCWQVWNS